MQMMMKSTDGLAFLISLNWDRLLYAGTLTLALTTGSWLGTVLTQ